MSEKHCKATKNDFIDAFIAKYGSSDITKGLTKEAYGKPYTVLETRANYKVTANGKTKRCMSLYSVASFIYEQNFDPKKTYTKHLTPAKARKLERIQNQLNKGNLWTDLTLTALPKSNVKLSKRYKQPKENYCIGWNS